MQLINLIKPLEDMNEEEILQRIHDLRHRREMVRPAKQAHIAKEIHKEKRKAISAAEKLLGQLSPEDLSALLKQLEGSQ